MQIVQNYPEMFVQFDYCNFCRMWYTIITERERKTKIPWLRIEKIKQIVSVLTVFVKTSNKKSLVALVAGFPKIKRNYQKK